MYKIDQFPEFPPTSNVPYKHNKKQPPYYAYTFNALGSTLTDRLQNAYVWAWNGNNWNEYRYWDFIHNNFSTTGGDGPTYTTLTSGATDLYTGPIGEYDGGVGGGGTTIQTTNPL